MNPGVNDLAGSLGVQVGRKRTWIASSRAVGEHRVKRRVDRIDAVSCPNA